MVSTTSHCYSAGHITASKDPLGSQTPHGSCGSGSHRASGESGHGVASDHQLLVGGNHPNRHAASATGDAGPVGRVGVLVELDTEPGRRLAYPSPDDRRALADAGGEDDRVEAAERRGQRAKLFADGIDEVVDGEL